MPSPVKFFNRLPEMSMSGGRAGGDTSARSPLRQPLFEVFLSLRIQLAQQGRLLQRREGGTLRQPLPQLPLDMAHVFQRTRRTHELQRLNAPPQRQKIRAAIARFPAAMLTATLVLPAQ